VSFSLTSPKNPNSDLDRGPIYETPEQQRDGVLRSDATQRWPHSCRQSPARLRVPGDVVSQYLSQVTGAIGRLDRLEPEDIKIVRPFLEGLERQYFPDNSIRFQQVGRKFVVDTTEFRGILGFGYLQELLKNRGQHVPTRTLSPVGEVIFEPIAERGVIHKNINRRYALEKKLRWLQRTHGLDDQCMCELDEALEVAEELLKIKKHLSGATYGGKPKHVHNDYDRNRQTVCKCMRLAIKYLEGHSETAYVGQHLRNNTTFGARPRYFGVWNWII